jgi:ElaB/YqjD/DUF883 family membrane-anchored ribosome-binding protein
MSLTSLKEIFAPLSSASDAMSDALNQAKSDLANGLGDARATLADGAQRSLKKAKGSRDRARRAWYERTDLVRDRSQDAVDQASATYRNALDAMSSAWNRAMKAFRDAGDQAGDLQVRVRKDATRYSRQGASWARENPHIVAGAVAVVGYFAIRAYRKRRAQRIEDAKDSVTQEVGDAANDEAVRATRLA